MSKKIIGFSIVIDGQKQILDTGKAFGLLNTQLILVNNTLNENLKLSDKTSKNLAKAALVSASSVDNLTKTFKSATLQYSKSIGTITDLGNGYLAVEDKVDKTAKSLKKQAKVKKVLAKTDKQRIAQLKKIKNLTKEQEQELKGLLKEQQKQRIALKELSDIAKQEAILETERVGTRKALKAQLRLITIQLNNMTEAEQLSTKSGKALTAQQKQLNDTLFNLESRGGTFSRRVGEYARNLFNVKNAAKAARKSIGGLALRLSVGRSVVEGLANGIRGTVNGLKDLISESDGTNEVFNKLEASGSRFTAVLKDTGRGFLNSFGGVITDVIDNFAFVFDRVKNAVAGATEGTGFFARASRQAIDIIRNFPAVLGGLGSIIEELTGRFRRFGTEAVLRFKQLGLSLKAAKEFITGGDVQAINRELSSIEQQLEDNTIASKTFSEAYKEGFDSTKEAQIEFKKRAQDLAEQEAENEKKREAREERRKKRVEARKKADEEEKQRIAQLQKDRESALSQAEQQAVARQKITLDLSREIADLQAEAIEDETDRLIEQESIRAQRQAIAREENFKALKDQIQKEQQEIERLFGASSQEAISNQRAQEQQLLELQASFNQLKEQQEAAHKAKISNIKQTAADKELEQQKQKEAKDLEQQKRANETQKAEEKKTNQQILEQKKENVQAGVDIFNTAASALTSFLEISQQQEKARLNSALAARREGIQDLNDRISDATGLQKRFLERQLKEEEKSLQEKEELAKAAEKKRAEEAKVVALGIAAINGAISITRAFADLGPIAGAVAAVGVAATLAVQVADIATQKFQDGGMLVGASHDRGGIPVSIRNTGVVEAEGGEFIVNKESTAKNLALIEQINNSKSTLKFQDGGILGAPSVAPIIGNNRSDSKDTKLLEAIASNSRAIEAMNSKISNQKVVLVYPELQEENQRQVQLTQRTTF